MAKRKAKRKPGLHDGAIKRVQAITGLPHSHAKEIVHEAHRRAFHAKHSKVITGLAQQMLQAPPPPGGIPPPPPGGVPPQMPPPGMAPQMGG